MPENENFKDVLTVEINTDLFKKSLEDMRNAYEGFIKSLDSSTKSSLGERVTGNVNSNLKELSSILLEFRKDATATITQLDSNITRFIDAILNRNTASIKKKASEALDEIAKIQEAVDQNAKHNALTEEEVISTLERGTRPAGPEKVRRDIEVGFQADEIARNRELLSIEEKLSALRGKKFLLDARAQIDSTTELTSKSEILKKVIDQLGNTLQNVTQEYKNAEKEAVKLNLKSEEGRLQAERFTGGLSALSTTRLPQSSSEKVSTQIEKISSTIEDLVTSQRLTPGGIEKRFEDIANRLGKIKSEFDKVTEATGKQSKAQEQLNSLIDQFNKIRSGTTDPDSANDAARRKIKLEELVLQIEAAQLKLKKELASVEEKILRDLERKNKEEAKAEEIRQRQIKKAQDIDIENQGVANRTREEAARQAQIEAAKLARIAKLTDAGGFKQQLVDVESITDAQKRLPVLSRLTEEYRQKLGQAAAAVKELRQSGASLDVLKQAQEQLNTAISQYRSIQSKLLSTDKQVANIRRDQADATEQLRKSLEGVQRQASLADVKLRAAQAESPQARQAILNDAAKEYSDIVSRLSDKLKNLPPPTTPEQIKLQKELTQQLSQAQSALTGITNQFKQAEIQSHGFFNRMIYGFKNTISLVIRFYATFAALQAIIDVIKFTIGAPFEILADGLKYMIGIEEAASDLIGVLAANVVFSKDLAENFKIASEVSKDLVQLLKQRAVASGSTFDSLNATFKALLQGGAFQTVKNLEELVTLAETFQLAIKAAGAGGLAAQGSIQEISKLFNGLPGDYNKFLALLKLTPKEWESIVKSAKTNRDLLDQILPRIQNYADNVKLAELNQARLAKAFGELIDRIGGEGSRPLFNFITEQLKVVVKTLEDQFNTIISIVDSISRSIVFLLGEVSSAALDTLGPLDELAKRIININAVVVKFIAFFTTGVGAIKDLAEAVAVLTSPGSAKLSGVSVLDVVNEKLTNIAKRREDIKRDIDRINEGVEKSLRFLTRPKEGSLEAESAKGEVLFLQKFREDVQKSITAKEEEIKRLESLFGGSSAASRVLGADLVKDKKQLDQLNKDLEDARFRAGSLNRLRDEFGAVPAPAITGKKASTKGDRDRLRELLEEFRLAREEFNEGAQDIREKQAEIRQDIQEQVSARKITYEDAAISIKKSVDDEIFQLEKLRFIVGDVAEEVRDKIRTKIIDPTIEREGIQKLDKELRQFTIQQQKSDFTIRKQVARADRDAAKERLNISVENAEQRSRIEEEYVRRQQELLGIARESGVFTEREYFDQIESLRKQQFDIDVDRLERRIALEEANTLERIKLENELATLKEKNSSSDARSFKQRELLLEREAQLAKDYALALKQVDIESQNRLLTLINELRAGAGYNDIIAESINLRAQELDLLEQNLQTQLDLASAKNSESEETRRLILQIKGLRNERDSLFDQQLREIQRGTSGLGAASVASRRAAVFEIRRRNFAEVEAQQTRDQFVQQNAASITALDPGTLSRLKVLDDEVKRTAQAARDLRVRVFEQNLKPTFRAFSRSLTDSILGPGIKNAFKDAEGRLDKTAVALDGAVNAIGNIGGIINSIKQGGSEGGILGGIGAGISALSPVLSKIPVVGQFLPAIGGILSFVGTLFTASAKRIAEDVKRSFSNTIENYQNGNASLIETLNALERQRSDAIIRLSGTKGGKKELDSILKEFDNELRQLRERQREIISDFDDSLNVLRINSETLSDINRKWQDINKQVKEYIGAGGDAAKAQEFLSLQLTRIREDAARQLAQAEQDAIQEAIRLNDLLKDRQNILDDFAKKEFEVITRSAIERRKSTFVSAGEELANLRKQRDEQLAALDDQIRLANIRLERQKDIFNLELDITALRRRDEELTLAALDGQLQRLRDLQQIANSITIGPNGLASSSLLQPANVNLNINLTGIPATDAGLEIVDTIESELSRRFRMTPVAV